MIALIVAAQVAAAPPQDTLLAAHRNLMPVPRSVVWGVGRLPLDSTFTVRVASRADARLDRAVQRMLARLEGRTGRPLSREIRGASGRLVITADGPGMPVQGVGEDESYALAVTGDSATLHAATTVGVIRGLETLLQLLEADRSGFSLPAVTVEDAPRFGWRGLLVDAGRHFMPPEVIRRTLDGMAAVKLNVLHWHLSEDQGFRVESRRFPKLQGLGSDGLFYTQQQIRDIVAYARDRGIRVVPEFDMPGHASSWFVGYPQYASADGPFAIVRDFGVFDPVFDPTRETVYGFIDGFIGEMAPLFPDAYWHVGGDEVNGREWAANPRIQAFMRARHLNDADALQTHFNQRLLVILQRHHKRMAGWDEILKPGLPTDALIQSWRGMDGLVSAARQGYSAILSSGYYLDHQSSAQFHYGADPLPSLTDLTAEQQARVLGGEACMWAEHVGPETVDSRIWPRLVAVAERLWSPREVNDLDDMYRRLRVTSAHLEELGLGHESHTGRMLRRIAGDDAPLLAGLLEFAQPVTFGQRSDLQKPNQLTPLASLVDAARPDPPSRWRAIHAARRLIAAPTDTAALNEVRSMLLSARAAAQAVIQRGPVSPALAQALPVAVATDSVAALGLSAARLLATGQRPGDEWLRNAVISLQRWGQPQGLLRITLGGATRILAASAGGFADSTATPF